MKRIILGLCIVLTACGANLTSGKVIDKDFRAAYTWIYMQPIPHTNCGSSGTSTTCSTTYTYIPIPMHEPDRWTVTVEDCTQSNDSGKCPKDTWTISEDYFNDSDIGEQITRPGE